MITKMEDLKNSLKNSLRQIQEREKQMLGEIQKREQEYQEDPLYFELSKSLGAPDAKIISTLIRSEARKISQEECEKMRVEITTKHFDMQSALMLEGGMRRIAQEEIAKLRIGIGNGTITISKEAIDASKRWKHDEWFHYKHPNYQDRGEPNE